MHLFIVCQHYLILWTRNHCCRHIFRIWLYLHQWVYRDDPCRHIYTLLLVWKVYKTVVWLWYKTIIKKCLSDICYCVKPLSLVKLGSYFLWCLNSACSASNHPLLNETILQFTLLNNSNYNYNNYNSKCWTTRKSILSWLRLLDIP